VASRTALGGHLGKISLDFFRLSTQWKNPFHSQAHHFSIVMVQNGSIADEY